MATQPSPSRTLVRSALRPDGGIDAERRGLRRSVFSDLYHFLLTVSWPGLIALLAGSYFALNALFAVLYLLGGDTPFGGDNIAGAEPGSFANAFQFSVQTFATIGYGVFSPKTTWAHTLVSVEALVGIVYSAFATGLTFAKFARPTARILFANRPVLCLHEGVPTLQIRIANGRFNQIVEAEAILRVSRVEVTAEGQSMRRFHDLKLVRSTSPVFALSWTLFHRVDESSPLHGLGPDQIGAADTFLIVSVSGMDETVASTVHARKLYVASDLAFNHRYVDIMDTEGGERLVIRYDRFHEIVPVEAAHRVPWVPGAG
jgi:inward rectifier potassium channel